jgi:hypothetical protein
MKILLQVPSFYPDRRLIFNKTFVENIKDNFPTWHRNIIDTTTYDAPYMCRYRTDILSNYDYIMQCDDDWVWRPDCVKYYKYIENILLCRQPDVLNVYGSRYSDKLISPKKCMIGTNRGLFIKTSLLLDDQDWLKSISDLKYGLEESVLVFKALEKGGKFYAIGGSPLERTYKSGNICYSNQSALHNLELIEQNCIKFIRDRYQDPKWDFRTGNFPKGLNMNNDDDLKQTQIGGSHYTKLAIQPFEYCYKNHLEGAESAVIAYVTRHRDKNKAEDLKKAIHTLELLLEAEYGERYDRSN